MNAYQEALLRIIELEDRNAELLETLEHIKQLQENEQGKCVKQGLTWNIALKAIRKAKGE